MSADQLFILGPCVIESEDFLRRTAHTIKEICDEVSADFVLKASYDKANRTSSKSYRGMSVEQGCKLLSAVGQELGVAVTTDVHSPEEARIAAEYIDVLQIPAFLCRQTDLIQAAAETGRVVNVKKGQFLSPWEVQPIADKLITFGCKRFFFTERGASFGYQNLVPTCGRFTGSAKQDTRLFLTRRIRCRGQERVAIIRLATDPWHQSWRGQQLRRVATVCSSKCTKIRLKPSRMVPTKFLFDNSGACSLHYSEFMKLPVSRSVPGVSLRLARVSLALIVAVAVFVGVLKADQTPPLLTPSPKSSAPSAGLLAPADTPSASPISKSGKGGSPKPPKAPKPPGTPKPNAPVSKDIPIILPIGEDALKVKIPQMGSLGQILQVFAAMKMTRVDADHLQLQGTRIDLNKVDGKSDYHIDIPTSVFDVKTRIITSDAPVVIKTEDFELTGERMRFDTLERAGELIGKVEMRVHNLKATAGFVPGQTPTKE